MRHQCRLFLGGAVQQMCNAAVAASRGIGVEGHSQCEARVFAGSADDAQEDACASLCRGSYRTGERVFYARPECSRCLYRVCRLPCISAIQAFDQCVADAQLDNRRATCEAACDRVMCGRGAYEQGSIWLQRVPSPRMPTPRRLPSCSANGLCVTNGSKYMRCMAGWRGNRGCYQRVTDTGATSTSCPLAYVSA